MTTAAANLYIKTEGVTESYRNIGRLLGPLQGINTLLYQLNKALGIQNKQALGSSKSLQKLAKEGNTTAQAQLELQKQLRATAKEANRAAKEQAANAKTTADTLKSLDAKVNFASGVKLAKDLAKATKEVVKFASDALLEYAKMGGQLDDATGRVAYIKEDWAQCKGIIAEIVTNDLVSYFGDCAHNVDILGGLLSSVYATTADIGGFVNKIGIVIGGVINTYVQQFQETIALFKAGDLWSALNHKADITGMMASITEELGRFDKKVQDSKARVDDLILNRRGWQELRAEVQKTATAATKQTKTAVAETELTAEEQHQRNLQRIAEQLAAQLAALDTVDGDEQVKFTLRDQLRRQALEAEKSERLRYAQETNDQLYLIDQQYRIAKEQADAALAQKQLEAQQRLQAELEANNKKWLDFANTLRTDLAQGALGELTGAASNLFDSMIEGEEMTRAGAYDMFRSLAKNVYQVGIQSLLKTVGELIMNAGNSAAQTPIIGPILAAAAMATMGGITAGLMAKYKPKQAQVSYENGGYISQGLVRGGRYGADSVTAALMPGERVLSKTEAKEYDKTSRPATPQIINIHVSGQFNTPAQITQMVRQTIIPELNKARQAGYAVGAGA